VEVRRNGALLDSLDLYDYLLRGDARGDVRLETGDVVFVPVRGPRVEVTGAVVRPAIYEARAGEAVADVIRAAGGFRPDADLKALTVYRFLPAAECGPGPAPHAALSVPLAAGLDGGGEVVIPGLDVRDGDSLVVHRAPSLDQSLTVWISGSVRRPGRYPWRPGMPLRDLVTLGGGPAIGGDLLTAEVARMPEDRPAASWRTRCGYRWTRAIWRTGRTMGRTPRRRAPPLRRRGPLPEFVLEPFDEVLLLQQPTFEFRRSVTVLGQVLVPGRTRSRTRTPR
jgi:protein involved in polysaccharide export with SLBB domain